MYCTNRKVEYMSPRQRALKLFYPLWMWVGRLKSGNRRLNTKNTVPPVSFYSLHTFSSAGDSVSFQQFKGKKVLIVNTASDCGFTPQYADLQKLYEENKELLQILAFPSNDFKEQEKGTNQEIEDFCKVNYGVSFPIMQKTVVMKGAHQNPVYKWLSDAGQNGWCNKQPSWNFSKYLINEQGILMEYFEPSYPPAGKDMLEKIKH